MKQIQHSESRDHIREHLQAAYFLVQMGENPLLRYLLEMALVENESSAEPAREQAPTVPRPKSVKAGGMLSKLLQSDLNLAKSQPQNLP